MPSALRILSVCFWLATLAGCRMCASPYDYCGPTYGVENCDDGCGCCGTGCSMTDRRGSILSHGAYDMDGMGCDDGAWQDGAMYHDGQSMPQDGQIIYEGSPSGAPSSAPSSAPSGAPSAAPAEEIPNEAMRPVPDPRMSRRSLGPGPSMGGPGGRLMR